MNKVKCSTATWVFVIVLVVLVAVAGYILYKSRVSADVATTTRCTSDTDGGDQPRIFGKILNGTATVAQDQCQTNIAGRKYLVEYYCKAAVASTVKYVYSKTYDCQGCLNGTCSVLPASPIPSLTPSPTPGALPTPTNICDSLGRQQTPTILYQYRSDNLNYQYYYVNKMTGPVNLKVGDVIVVSANWSYIQPTEILKWYAYLPSGGQQDIIKIVEPDPAVAGSTTNTLSVTAQKSGEVYLTFGIYNNVMRDQLAYSLGYMRIVVQ